MGTMINFVVNDNFRYILCAIRILSKTNAVVAQTSMRTRACNDIVELWIDNLTLPRNIFGNNFFEAKQNVKRGYNIVLCLVCSSIVIFSFRSNVIIYL